jgi:hypothetical protein
MEIKNWVKILLISTTIPPFKITKTKLEAKVFDSLFEVYS